MTGDEDLSTVTATSEADVNPGLRIFSTENPYYGSRRPNTEHGLALTNNVQAMLTMSLAAVAEGKAWLRICKNIPAVRYVLVDESRRLVAGSSRGKRVVLKLPPPASCGAFTRDHFHPRVATGNDRLAIVAKSLLLDRARRVFANYLLQVM